MRRRDLFQFGAAALVLGSTRGLARAVAPLRGNRTTKKSLKYGMIRIEGSVLDKFELVKRLGYDGVELDSPSELDSEEVLEAKAKTGLEIPGVVDSVHWQKTLGDPDANVRAEGVNALETALRECQLYGGTTVLLVPAVVNASITYAEAYERSQTEIRKVLPLAEEVGVKIAFENVWNDFLLSPLEAARYVDEFESPWVGWYLDVGNLVRYGWPVHWARTLGSRVLKIDVKGFSRTLQREQGLWDGFKVEIGEDDCNWSAVMAELEAAGYMERSGWASAEVGGGGEERLGDVLARMRNALDTP